MIIYGNPDVAPKRAPEHAPELAFEGLARAGADGQCYWSSHELAQVLGYRSPRAFTAVLEKARQACANSGHDVAAHFVREAATRATRLSRYACYLVIQNANPAKVSVALGQTYLAAQARRQELAANLFRATQTDEKIRRDRVHGAAEACRLHHHVGRKVRQAMAEISGVMPEDLPVVEDINAVRRRVKRLQAAEAPAPARVMA